MEDYGKLTVILKGSCGDRKRTRKDLEEKLPSFFEVVKETRGRGLSTLIYSFLCYENRSPITREELKKLIMTLVDLNIPDFRFHPYQT